MTRENSQPRIRVTMDDVARASGVSRATVSRVLTGKATVSPDTHDKVHRAIQTLGYVPNYAAQTLASGGPDTRTVGLLLRDPRNPTYGLLHHELQKYCDAAGLRLVTVTPTQRRVTADELSALQTLLTLQVNGIFLATGSIRPSDVEGVLDAVPMITVGRPEFHEEISAVSYNENDHGEMMADAVIAHGHRRVGVAVTHPDHSVPEHRRSVAMARRLRSAGVEVTEVPVQRHSHPMESAREMISLVREHQITAAMFPTDHRAFTFLQACSAAGLRVPEDVSVTGLDGTSQELGYVGLTTLRIPVEEVAAKATDLMQERLENPRRPVTHEAFSGVLVEGTSLARMTHG